MFQINITSFVHFEGPFVLKLNIELSSQQMSTFIKTQNLKSQGVELFHGCKNLNLQNPNKTN